MDTFRAFSPLTDFAKKAQDLFTKTRNNPSGQLHIIGIDDPAGTYQSQVLAANGGDDSLGVEAPTKTNGVPGASYTGLTTKGSPTQDKGKEIYDKFVETSKNGGLVFQNNAGSVRTTTLMITHRFAMGIVSTSHW
ncbi:Mycoplasma MG185/MG260 protein, partial [Mycoplasmopsis synoviae]